VKTTETIVAEFNKKFGGEVLITADRLPEQLGRIPSGSLVVDVATGGGWPQGHWSEITGAESSGKTALCLLTVAAAQRLDPAHVTVWIAAEEFVPSWARALGVDLSRVHLINTNVAESALDAALAFMENRACDLVVIDSLPALVPDEENTKDMDEPQVALLARLVSKFFRKAAFAMHRMPGEDRPCTGMVINQFRSNIGAWSRYGEPTTTPGGRAKNYYFFVRAEISRVNWLGDKDTKVGQRVRLAVKKNKTAPSQRTAEFDFYFAEHEDFMPGDIDRAGEIVSVALLLGVINRSGAWYYVGERKFQGVDAVLAEAKLSPEFYEVMRTEVMGIVTGGKQLTPAPVPPASVVKKTRRRG
jgi:recombination protein RecA